jgi:predicted bacteriocin transport accessory protein
MDERILRKEIIMSKKSLFFGLLIILITFFLTAFVFCNLPSAKKEKTKMENEYLQLQNKPSVFTPTSAEDILYKLEQKNTFSVFFGFPKCPWCQALAPEVDKVAKELGIASIYYVDILSMRDDETDSHHDSYLKLAQQLSVILDKNKNRINAPTLVEIVNGEVVAYHLDTVESHIKTSDGVLPSMTDKQKEELETILKHDLSYLL